VVNRSGRILVLGLLVWSGAVLVTPPPAAAQQCTTMTLTLEGGSDGSATTTITPGADGDVDFGLASTMGGEQPGGAGERVRVNSGGPGAHFVATIVATVTFADGVDCGSVACGPSPCVPAGQQGQVELYQTPVSLPATRTRYALGVSQDWTAEGAGAEVPTTQQPLQGPVNDGESIVHQIAFMILDSDPAGLYSTQLSYILNVP
jgi:hypothetical protein